MKALPLCEGPLHVGFCHILIWFCLFTVLTKFYMNSRRLYGPIVSACCCLAIAWSTTSPKKLPRKKMGNYFRTEPMWGESNEQ